MDHCIRQARTFPHGLGARLAHLEIDLAGGVQVLEKFARTYIAEFCQHGWGNVVLFGQPRDLGLG